MSGVKGAPKISSRKKVRYRECPVKKAARQLRWQRRNLPRLRAYNAKRKARKNQAMPLWADRDRIRGIYSLAAKVSRVTGVEHHVDHIVPLRSDLVCGLHVEHNLQVLNGKRNRKKNNKCWPDKPT